MPSDLILALDTSSAACTAALFDSGGALLGQRDSFIGRGHAEHLMPLIAELMDGRAAGTVLVGCGPGSFTGLRVGLAAAHGLAIGWDCELFGFSSLALLAASAPGEGPLTVAVAGGHGELFLQAFTRSPLAEAGPLRNLPPEAAASAFKAPLTVGSGAEALVAAGAPGEALAIAASAAMALALPPAMRALPPKPIYARAPDARPRAA
jgi:tRNA threonylcarbamoyl adenosine modification protein YeaZ